MNFNVLNDGIIHQLMQLFSSTYDGLDAVTAPMLHKAGADVGCIVHAGIFCPMAILYVYVN